MVETPEPMPAHADTDPATLAFESLREEVALVRRAGDNHLVKHLRDFAGSFFEQDVDLINEAADRIEALEEKLGKECTKMRPAPMHIHAASRTDALFARPGNFEKELGQPLVGHVADLHLARLDSVLWPGAKTMRPPSFRYLTFGSSWPRPRDTVIARGIGCIGLGSWHALFIQITAWGLQGGQCASRKHAASRRWGLPISVANLY